MTTPASFEQQADDFGQDMAGLLRATLPGLPDPPVDVDSAGGQTVITTQARTGLPVLIGGKPLAGMRISFTCAPDLAGNLAVEETDFTLLAALDRAPLLRMHHYRAPRSKPGGHLHVYGQRGALSHLLSQSGAHGTAQHVRSPHTGGRQPVPAMPGGLPPVPHQ